MSQALPDALRPDWAAPPGTAALMSTRAGGCSAAPFDSLNLRPPALGGDGADDPAAVLQNQQRFAAALGATPVWLNQVHGADVVRLDASHLAPGNSMPRADASFSTERGVACAVLVADCLPVLMASADGRVVGAVHAGWRGLAAGVVEHTVAAMVRTSNLRAGEIQAWLGACIGADAFEVGEDVLRAFGTDAATADPARFAWRPRADGSPRWRADLALLARDRLIALGLRSINGGRWCTVADRSRFFSFRRDGRTGRMAAAIARIG